MDTFLECTPKNRNFTWSLFDAVKFNRNFFLTVCAAALLFCSCACRVAAQEYRRDWSDGKLTWADFSERKGGERATGFKFFLGYRTEKQKEGIERLIRPVAVAYMDARLSFADPERRTDLLLRYNQVIFDITEWYRRSLQEALYEAQSPLQAEAIFKYHYDSLEGDLRQFKEDAGYGTAKDAVDFWEQRVAERLEGTDPDPFPEIRERNFGYGIHAGLAGVTFLGGLNEQFRPGLGFSFGFDMAFRRFMLNVGGTIYRPAARRDLDFGPQTAADERLNFALIELTAGYILIDRPRWRLTPSAGLGISEFSPPAGNDNEAASAVVDFNLMCGFTLDYKLSRSLRLIPSPFALAGGVKEKSEFSVRFRAFLAPARFEDGLRGTSVNLSLGISGFGRLLRTGE